MALRMLGAPCTTLFHRECWVLLLAFPLAVMTASAARADELDHGHGRSALPASDLVPLLAGDRAQPIRANASLGYGYTEAVQGAGDTHHRTDAQLALSYQPLEEIALAGRFDARLDTHTGDAGGDEGFATQSWLVARASVPAGERVRVGAEAALRFPGASDVGRSFSATSPEARALITFAPAAWRTWLSGSLGFRLDRARHGLAEPERLSLHDRVGLGASDANAVLLGVGAVRSFGGFALLGEWTWDLQVGGRAAAPFESPMRLTAGARWFLSPSVHLQLLAGVSPSARPAVTASEPLYPIEPRVFGALGLGMRFGAAPAAQPPPARIEPQALPLPPPEPPPPTVRRVSGRVVDSSSHAPLAGATVDANDGTSAATDAAGLFVLDGMPLSFVELRVHADGFNETVVPVGAGDGQAQDLEIELEPSHPTALIRGTVSNFRGRLVAGRVVVQPGNFTAVLDADASFELEVPPGEYTVLIAAPGYDSQERLVRVERGDVAVIVVQVQAER
jgi:hypothetical protein